MASNENSGGKVDLSQYSKKFVTESEVEESRKKRQEEWERVRQPHQPKEAPADAPEDRRCLFEKLQEQKDLKQAEHDDKYALKNLVRGYDDEEADFLKTVHQLKEEQEKNKQDEEDQLLAEFRSNVSNQVIDKSDAKPSTRSQKPVEQKHKSQVQLLAGAIKRKRTSSTSDDHVNEKKSTTDVVPGSSNGVARVVAILPGIGVYTDSDDSDSSSDSDIDLDFFKRAKGCLQDVHGH